MCNFTFYDLWIHWFTQPFKLENWQKRWHFWCEIMNGRRGCKTWDYDYLKMNLYLCILLVINSISLPRIIKWLIDHWLCRCLAEETTISSSLFRNNRKRRLCWWATEPSSAATANQWWHHHELWSKRKAGKCSV